MSGTGMRCSRTLQSLAARHAQAAAHSSVSAWQRHLLPSPAPHKLSNGTEICGTNYGFVGPPTRAAGTHAILMSGKSCLSRSSERDN
eukprot:365391-Chlamydomonas_euryale.AAC.2